MGQNNVQRPTGPHRPQVAVVRTLNINDYGPPPPIDRDNPKPFHVDSSGRYWYNAYTIGDIMALTRMREAKDAVAMHKIYSYCRKCQLQGHVEDSFRDCPRYHQSGPTAAVHMVQQTYPHAAMPTPYVPPPEVWTTQMPLSSTTESAGSTSQPPADASELVESYAPSVGPVASLANAVADPLAEPATASDTPPEPGVLPPADGGYQICMMSSVGDAIATASAEADEEEQKRGPDLSMGSRIFVVAAINGYPAYALCDSGSDITIMSKRF